MSTGFIFTILYKKKKSFTFYILFDSCYITCTTKHTMITLGIKCYYQLFSCSFLCYVLIHHYLILLCSHNLKRISDYWIQYKIDTYIRPERIIYFEKSVYYILLLFLSGRHNRILYTGQTVDKFILLVFTFLFYYLLLLLVYTTHRSYIFCFILMPETEQYNIRRY